MFQRLLAQKLIFLASQFPILGVVGPRQAGKTTLVQMCFPDYQYVTLENLDIREFAEQDPRGFFAQYNDRVIIDEIQRVPSLFSYLQGIVDTSKKVGQFILTGSHHFLLLEKMSQSLAGRIALLQLLPLSLREQHHAGLSFASLEETLFHGFYPRVLGQSIEPYHWYTNYIQTYIERDVRQIKNILDLGQFQLFLKMCANRVGQLLNLSQLAAECGITHNTAKSWISILEASFIVFQLRPHYKNFNKRLVKMPKLYFYDTGILCALLGVKQKEELLAHHMKGALFENMIIADLLKSQYHQALIPSIYFWRDQQGHELDCLIEQNEQLIPMEIKSGKTIHSEFLNHLNYWQQLSESHSKGYLIYGGEAPQLRSNVQILSWQVLKEEPTDSTTIF